MSIKSTSIVLFIILLLLSCFMSPLVSAEKRVTVLDSFQFDEPLNNVDEAVAVIPFNITLPSSNSTLIVSYENKIDGTKMTETYTKAANVFLYDVRVLSKQFEPNAQEFLISVELSKFEKGFYSGKVLLLGTGELRFYGTVSMYLERTSSKGIRFIGLDLWIWITILITPAILVFVIFMKRRRRRRLEDI